MRHKDQFELLEILVYLGKILEESKIYSRYKNELSTQKIKINVSQGCYDMHLL